MTDVAREAGVSLMTVSRVVNHKEDVSPKTRQRVLEVIERLGYRPSSIARGLVTKHTSTYKRGPESGSTINPYVLTDQDRMIEPHISLEESWFGLKVDITPGVWQRAVRTQLSGQSCLVLSPEDLLLHICVHLSFHLIMGAPSMVQLTDVAVIAARLDFDSARLLERVGVTRSAPFVYAALVLARKLLGAPLPGELMSGLADMVPTAQRSRIEALDLRHVLNRTQQKPIHSLSERLRRGFRDRAETASWAPDWRGRLAVWRTALEIWKTDTGRMVVGK